MPRFLSIIGLLAILAAGIWMVPWVQVKLARQHLRRDYAELSETIEAHPYHQAREVQRRDPQRRQVHRLLDELEKTFAEMQRQPSYDEAMEKSRTWSSDRLSALQPWCDRLRAEIRSLPEPLAPAIYYEKQSVTAVPLRLARLLIAQAGRAASEGRHDDAAAICADAFLMNAHAEAQGISVVGMIMASCVEREVFAFLSTIARDDSEGFPPEAYARALGRFLEHEFDVHARALALQRSQASRVAMMILAAPESENFEMAAWDNTRGPELIDALAQRAREEFAVAFAEPPPPLTQIETFVHMPTVIEGLRERRALRRLMSCAFSLVTDDEARQAGVLIGLEESGARYEHPDTEFRWPAAPGPASPPEKAGR
jgi:hypothetical protein